MEHKKRILIVDDEPAIIKIIKFRLLREGYEVLEANEGMEGVEMARQEIPDLIVLDMMMPNMTGYEVIQLLKLDEKYKKIPILVLTGQKEKCDKEFTFALGADDYMCKPFVSEELLAKIKEMLGDK